jgi:protein-S-isoprenylcysteine O-methyltransferase Ste14
MAPAWSLSFWQGWIYCLIFAGCQLGITLYFLRHDPALIERRMRGGPRAEKEPTQKTILAWTTIVAILMLLFPAFDHRFGWSHIPPSAVILADAAVVVGFAIVFLTFKANSYASAIIEVKPEQEVASDGPYAIVRHPMYAGATLVVLATPIALGSAWAIIPALAIVAGIVWRLLDEERLLSQNLSGYAEYCERTRYRLAPGVW